MGEVNLLDAYPRSTRPIAERVQAKAGTDAARAEAKTFGKTYFDGTREQGYGGYYYDGRWKPVAERMTAFYGLNRRSSILDVGCAKGFLVLDLCEFLPGATVVGVDVSRYAIENAHQQVKSRLAIANATHLPFSDNSFDLVISINVVHNLKDGPCQRAIQEMNRVSRQHKYLQVDSYRTPEEKQNLEHWQLTAETIFSPVEWQSLFQEVKYSGDYFWTITE